MKLYKYCGENYLIDNLVNNQLYFNAAGNLNDVSEGLHNFEISEDLKEKLLKFFYKENITEDLLIRFETKGLINNIVDHHMETLKDEVGISSFSTNNDDTTMWAHYANDSKGVCLEFDSSNSILKNALQVSYSDSIYTIKINDEKLLNEMFFHNQAIKLLTTKSKDWQDEKEWRLIAGAGMTANYEPEALTAIYLGFRTKPSLIREIFEKTKNLKGLKYYRQFYLLRFRYQA